mmetsp:Transcript_711/g.1545  ORF Transcript_711/g.1545 Transcript_711/m.1545 type:complete len:254 (+) Transcript_711:268-1029(+)
MPTGREHKHAGVMGWHTLGHKSSIMLTEIRMNIQAPHLALLAGEARDIGKGQSQILCLGVMIHQQNDNLSSAHRFVEELPAWHLAVVRDDRPLHLHVKVSELDIRIRLLERTPTMTCPCLVHCNDFLVGDDLPHRVHHGVVVHIQRQGQWRGDDGPGAEVGTRFEEGQTWIAGATRAMLATHLQHVWIGPTARLRQVLLCPFDGGQQVAHNATIGGPHVSRGPEEIPGAPSGIGHSAAPMTVLNHDGSARLVE